VHLSRTLLSCDRLCQLAHLVCWEQQPHSSWDKLNTALFLNSKPRVLATHTPHSHTHIRPACPGVAKYGQPLSLEDSAGLKVDLIVVGSSAVSRNGARLGKGEVSVKRWVLG
jgi:5-formyltetrahydrofolate cyclo-ligase